MLDFLRNEGVSSRIISEIEHFRSYYKINAEYQSRIPVPQYRYYGTEVWEEAASALLAGETFGAVFASLLLARWKRRNAAAERSGSLPED